jgi:hypothetical protein
VPVPAPAASRPVGGVAGAADDPHAFLDEKLESTVRQAQHNAMAAAARFASQPPSTATYDDSVLLNGGGSTGDVVAAPQDVALVADSSVLEEEEAGDASALRTQPVD